MNSLLISTLSIVLLFRILVISSLVFALPNNVHAADCAKYLDNLNNVRAQQRAGYSAKKGNKLKDKESKAHKKWWDCKSGKLKAKTKTKAKKKSTATKKRNQTQYRQSSISPKKNQAYKLSKAPKNGFSSQAIVAKQKYQGGQQKRWLVFYKKPKGCTRPKTMKAFTHCIEDKNNQQIQFEQQEERKAQE